MAGKTTRAPSRSKAKSTPRSVTKVPVVEVNVPTTPKSRATPEAKSLVQLATIMGAQADKRATAERQLGELQGRRFAEMSASRTATAIPSRTPSPAENPSTTTPPNSDATGPQGNAAPNPKNPEPGDNGIFNPEGAARPKDPHVRMKEPPAAATLKPGTEGTKPPGNIPPTPPTPPVEGVTGGERPAPPLESTSSNSRNWKKLGWRAAKVAAGLAALFFVGYLLLSGYSYMTSQQTAMQKPAERVASDAVPPPIPAEVQKRLDSLTQQLAELQKRSSEPEADHPFDIAKWDSYDGPERLGVIHQKCGDNWPTARLADQQEAGRKLANVPKDVGEQIVKTCNVALLDRPSSPVHSESTNPSSRSVADSTDSRYDMSRVRRNIPLPPPMGQ